LSGNAVTALDAPALDIGFFARSVHDVARDLIGCTLIYGQSGGVIVETESYARDDPACHAYNGPTPRSSILFGPPGRAYVYLSYGIHSLLNAVAETDGEPGAVLIRALEPTIGLAAMIRRRKQGDVRGLCSGPGKLTEALGIGLEVNGAALTEPPFRIVGRTVEEPAIVATSRIGITKAAERPWRFCVAGSEFVSVRPRAA
jgi:DNA-3-methyladenine glycosylase